MRCVDPYVAGKAAFGCGRCLPCLQLRRRVWTHRLMLEGLDHADKSFVTLTYSDEKCPDELRPDHLRDWLKRMRKRVAPRKLRYYAVGEYGARTGRPHYHIALFGWPSCYTAGGIRQLGECQCLACSAVKETWGFGFVMCGRLETKSAAYIGKYVLKKMTMRTDPRLNGRFPEFSRMSLKPGIGANAMWNVASEVLRYQGRYAPGEVPMGLDFGKVRMPLGRYLTRRLRVMCGYSEGASESSLQTLANQMQYVRAFAWSNDRSVSSVFEELWGPYAAQLAAKAEMRSQNETF